MIRATLTLLALIALLSMVVCGGGYEAALVLGGR